MKNILSATIIVAVFFIGLLLGWRVTISTARVEIESENLVSITAWGQTDMYVDSNPGVPDEIILVDSLGF